MKTKLTVLLFLIATGVLWCQDDCAALEDVNEKIECLERKLNALKLGEAGYHTGDSAEIAYDFLGGQRTISLPQHLKVGDFFTIRIKNINRNMWRVLLNTADSVQPSRLRTPTFADLQIETLSGLTAVLSQSVGLSETPLSVNALASQNKIQLLSGSSFANFKSEATSEAIESEFNRVIELLNQRTTSHDEHVTAIDNLKFGISKKQLEAKDQTNTVTSDFDLDTTLKEIERLRKELQALQETLGTEEKAYLKFSKDNEDAIKKGKLTKKDQEIKKHFSDLKSNIAKILVTINAENSLVMLQSVFYLKEKDGDYVSVPIQVKNGRPEVNMQFIPKDSLMNEDPRSISFIFPTQQRAYWSVDAAFYGASLYDESFSSITTPLPDEQNEVRFVEEDVAKFEIGLASLIRFGWKPQEQDPVTRETRLLENEGIHFVFGPGVSISERVRPRLLLGAGFSLGNKHAISFDFGGIAGFVERKSNAFELGDTLGEAPESLTVSRLKVGIFGAVSYTFKL